MQMRKKDYHISLLGSLQAGLPGLRWPGRRCGRKAPGSWPGMGLRLSPENILITHIDPGGAEECPWQFGCDLGEDKRLI